MGAPRRWFTAIAAALLIAFALLGPSVGTAAAGTGAKATEIRLPASAPRPSESSLSGVACSSSQSCVAVGSYEYVGGSVPVPDSGHAMVVSEKHGVWGQASEVVPPPNAFPPNQRYYDNASLDGVACPAAGSCVAVGSYVETSGEWQAMVLSEKHGVWGQASEIAPPANAASDPSPKLNAVACQASGSCVAVGEYEDSSHHRPVMIVSETGGVWGQAIEVSLPSNAASGPYVPSPPGEVEPPSPASASSAVSAVSGPAASLEGVACPASGSCVAAGSYLDSSGDTQPMVVSEKHGVWGQASELTRSASAAGSQIGLAGVSCPLSGACVAVGYYGSSEGTLPGSQYALVASERHGSWGQASGLTPMRHPASLLRSRAATMAPSELRAVSCQAPGSCLAVDNTSGTFSQPTMLVGEKRGHWRRIAREITPPPGAKPNTELLFSGVSCQASGFCVAVGDDGVGSGWEAVAVTGIPSTGHRQHG
jgi:hypothetical protein